MAGPKIDLSSSLAEAVVLLALQKKDNGPSIISETDYHREADSLYTLTEQNRAQAFDVLHKRLFRQGGFMRPLEEALATMSVLGQTLRLIAISRDETVEGCFLSQDKRDMLITLRPERFFEPDSLTHFLRSEMLHLQDMLDPRFGYHYEQNLGPRYGIPEALIRERYRLLWDFWIDARLAARGEEALTPRQKRFEDTLKGLPLFTEGHLQRLFVLFGREACPTHQDLLAWSVSPLQLFRNFFPNEAAGLVFLPGSPCPLCHFPTHAWKTSVALESPSIILRLQKDFPDWTPEMGICDRCFELYELPAKEHVWTGQDAIS